MTPDMILKGYLRALGRDDKEIEDDLWGRSGFVGGYGIKGEVRLGGGGSDYIAAPDTRFPTHKMLASEDARRGARERSSTLLRDLERMDEKMDGNFPSGRVHWELDAANTGALDDATLVLFEPSRGADEEADAGPPAASAAAAKPSPPRGGRTYRTAAGGLGNSAPPRPAVSADLQYLVKVR